ncbi:Gfo/Idh/MocA family protein [Amycolatopsis sp. NPDC059027]|uniref:Gfo/Idh/MocA family protein n=1 Tax=Amycolatopsis sp. NPDC059027 TaxID=3346709 RepID=UPI003671583D
MPERNSGRVLRIGVVGCADIAIRRVLPALAELEPAELVAVASRHAGKAAAVAARFGCEAITGYQNLLARDDIDAVYVPLPPSMHHEWATRALRTGKHVLCEKPLTTSHAQTTELVALARDLGLVLAENFMFLHHSQHDAVRKLVDEDAIGAPQVFSSSFGIPPLHPASFRYTPGLGSGALLDVGVYPLRVAQLFLSADLEVRGATLRIGETGVDVAGTALLRAPGGVTAQLAWGFEHSYRSTYSLWGTRGRLSVLRAFTPPEHHKPLVRLEQQDLVTEYALPADHQVRNTLAAFVNAALTDGEPPSFGRALLEQSALVEQVRQAAAESSKD